MSIFKFIIKVCALLIIRRVPALNCKKPSLLMHCSLVLRDFLYVLIIIITLRTTKICTQIVTCTMHYTLHYTCAALPTTSTMYKLLHCFNHWYISKKIILKLNFFSPFINIVSNTYHIKTV